MCIRDSNGAIQASTAVWRQGMDEWLAASTTELAKHFDETGGPTPETVQATMAHDAKIKAKHAPPGKTKSVKGFHQWLQASLILFIIATALLTLTEFNTLSFFSDINNDNFVNETAIEQKAILVDLLTGVAALFYLVTFVSCVFAYCFFFQRAQTNLLSMRVPTATVRPYETWVWYFVPFANLFKPIGPFNEVQTASHESAGKSALGSGIVTVWWLTWLLGNIISNISARMPQDDIPSMSRSLYVAIIASACIIISAFLLLRMVKSIGTAHEIARLQSSNLVPD